MHESSSPPATSAQQRILNSLAFSNAVYAPDLQQALALLSDSRLKSGSNLNLIHHQGFPESIISSDSSNSACQAHHQPLLCATISSRDQTELIVACRGTSSISDVVQDLKCLPAPLQYAAQHTAHWGFAQRADSIPLNHFLEFLRSGGSITFTGHSLGGAVASLLAIRLLEATDHESNEAQMSNQIRCITFGAPLFAGSGLAERIAARYRAAFLHVVLRGDCVPKLLPFVSALQRMLCNDDHWEGFRITAGLIARFLPRALYFSSIAGLVPAGLLLLRAIVPASFSYDFAGRFLLLDGSSIGTIVVSKGEEMNAWHSRLRMAFGFWRAAFSSLGHHRIQSYEDAIVAAPEVVLSQSFFRETILHKAAKLMPLNREATADAVKRECFLFRWKPGQLLGVIGRIARNVRALKSVCVYSFFFRAVGSFVHRSLVVERAPLPF